MPEAEARFWIEEIAADGAEMRVEPPEQVEQETARLVMGCEVGIGAGDEFCCWGGPEPVELGLGMLLPLALGPGMLLPLALGPGMLLPLALGLGMLLPLALGPVEGEDFWESMDGQESIDGAMMASRASISWPTP